jgi:glycosyltransferase involved in cell wall biosynthesis
LHRVGAGELEPLVSCIIIFLNEQKYLAEAIESVIAQSYDNWELLLVDDGSTDDSEKIARSFCERFPGKIRYLTHEGRENRGMSASRNLGLRHAKGEYAAFLDGDDWWLPNKLERQIALFRQYPQAIMVCGATVYWHSWNEGSGRADQTVLVGQWDRKDGTAVLELNQDRLYERGELMHRLYPLGKGVTPSSSGNMFRRAMALAVGGYDESFRGLFEDQVFRAKTYLQGPIFISSEVFDRYRQHDESCFHVSKATGQSDQARHQFLQWLDKYLDEVGSRDRRVRWKLRRKKLRHAFPVIRRFWARFARR